MRQAGVLAIVAALLSTAAMADSLEIGPTRVQMIGAERAATITIRNSDAAPANIQIRTMDWSQIDGADQYAPSRVLMASPPQVALAPGESQVIRLVAENLPTGAEEKSFRLVIDQIPTDQAPGATGVRTAIRALVPVFVAPSTADRPRLRWRARRSAEGVTLTATNEGNAHERLIAVSVGTGGRNVGEPIEGYILPKAQRSWSIRGVPAAARTLQIAGEGDFGEVRADVPLAP